MSRSIAATLIVMLIASLLSPVAWAQTQPAAGVQVLEATITGIEGSVRVRANENEPWVRAEVGMKLNEMAEFETGPRSAVRFVIPPEQTVTVDRLTRVKLLQAIDNNGKLQTRLGMQYGRTRFGIEAAGREHDATIASPNSTLAVRGTEVITFDQAPFAPQATSLTGRAEYRDLKKSVAFGGANAGKTKVDTESDSAADLALSETTLDPKFQLARAESEAPIIDRLLSSGSTVFFDETAGIKVVRGGIPPTDQQLIPALPGVLNVVARWQTDADLNLSLATPGGVNGAGEILYPIGALATNSSGGRVAFDHRGGPNGGIEIIYFPNVPGDGLYGIGLTLISGPTTTAQVDAFMNGERVGIFNGFGTVDSVTVDVPTPIPGFVDGTAVGVLPIGVSVPTPSSVSVQSTSTSPKVPTLTAKTSTVTTSTPKTVSRRTTRTRFR